MSGYSDVITYLTDGIVILPEEIQSIIIEFSDIPQFLPYYDRFLVKEDTCANWDCDMDCLDQGILLNSFGYPIEWVGDLRYSSRSNLTNQADKTLLDMYISHRIEKHAIHDIFREIEEKYRHLTQPLQIDPNWLIYMSSSETKYCYMRHEYAKYIDDDKISILLEPHEKRVLKILVARLSATLEPRSQYETPYNLAESIVLEYIKKHDAIIPFVPTLIGTKMSQCDINLIDCHTRTLHCSVCLLYMPPDHEWNQFSNLPDMQYQDYVRWDPNIPRCIVSSYAYCTYHIIYTDPEQEEEERSNILDSDFEYALEWSEYMGYELDIYDKSFRRRFNCRHPVHS